MILLFLGNLRATISVLLSIPISCLAAFIALNLGASTINTMVLGGIALALSRLIDNSVVVLENIFRHMELGSRRLKLPSTGAMKSTSPCWPLTSAPASCSSCHHAVGCQQIYFLALWPSRSCWRSLLLTPSPWTVVPLFCAKFIRLEPEHSIAPYGTLGGAEEASKEVEEDKDQAREHLRRIVVGFNRQFERLQHAYKKAIARLSGIGRIDRMQFRCFRGAEFALYPFLGVAFFPRTDPGNLWSMSKSRRNAS